MKSNYKLVNQLIVVAMAAIFFYCAFFDYFGDWSVKCAYKQATGKLCIGCGLTRGIHEIIFFNFSDAVYYNENAVRIFEFFLITLIIRLIINYWINKRISTQSLTIVMYLDIIISISLFVWSYKNFLANAITVQ